MSFFGGKKPQAPVVTPAPVAPVIEDAAVKAEQDAEAQRRKRGRAYTVMTGPQGAADPQVAQKALLGA